MTKIQEAFICELLIMGYKYGFDSSYPIEPIAKKLGVIDTIYDNNTETGILWDIGQKTKGYIHVTADTHKQYAAINFDLKDSLERWCNFKQYTYDD